MMLIKWLIVGENILIAIQSEDGDILDNQLDHNDDDHHQNHI